MIIFKLTDVFELHVQFKMMKLQLSRKTKEIRKSFSFQYFQKRKVYLEPIQISKMELFVNIVKSVIPLTI